MNIYTIIPTIALFILLFTIFSTNMAPLFGDAKIKGLLNIKNIILSSILSLAMVGIIIFLQLNKYI